MPFRSSPLDTADFRPPTQLVEKKSRWETTAH